MVRTTVDLISMVKRVNLLVMRMKKQGRKCPFIFSLLRKVFAKHFKVFHKFGDKTAAFFLGTIFVYLYVYFYVYIILYVCIFVCNLLACVCCSVFVLQFLNRLL